MVERSSPKSETAREKVTVNAENVGDRMGVTPRDREFAAQILEDFSTFEEGIENQEKLAQWLRNVRRAATSQPDGGAQSESKPWRNDMENAPKDRPFLAYWHMSDIYGVLEWIDNKWIDQDGDEVIAFRLWSLFDLPESAPQLRTSQHAEQQPKGDPAGCGADTSQSANPSTASSGDATGDRCPKCNANFDGGPIPEEIREHYPPPYRWSRKIGISDGDDIYEWRCPDCEHRWGRAVLATRREGGSDV